MGWLVAGDDDKDWAGVLWPVPVEHKLESLQLDGLDLGSRTHNIITASMTGGTDGQRHTKKYGCKYGHGYIRL